MFKRAFRLEYGCALVLILLSLAAIFAPHLSPFSYEEQDIEARLETPSSVHIMGTDTLGRDLFSRILYGARMSLGVGAATALVALLIGTLTGSIAGYFGGRIDTFLMRFVAVSYTHLRAHET